MSSETQRARSSKTPIESPLLFNNQRINWLPSSMYHTCHRMIVATGFSADLDEREFATDCFFVSEALLACDPFSLISISGLLAIIAGSAA